MNLSGMDSWEQSQHFRAELKKILPDYERGGKKIWLDLNMGQISVDSVEDLIKVVELAKELETDEKWAILHLVIEEEEKDGKRQLFQRSYYINYPHPMTVQQWIKYQTGKEV